MRLQTILPALLLSTAICGFTQSGPARPKITGVSHLAIYTSNPSATEHYYTFTIGAAKMADPENPKGVKYALSGTQYVEVLPLPANAGVNRMDHAAFNTDNAEGMRKYLAAKGWQVPASVTKTSDGSRRFQVLDSEGNKIEFVQPPANAKVDAPNAIGHHIIHVGFVVHDRTKEDTFYRTLLGFRPYWFGGMTDDKIDWISQQVPDGHDWVEYMMNNSPNISQQTLGVLDHIAIGQNSVDEGLKTLKAGNRLEGVRADSSTKIGKDGKGQFNMYDPDGIRAELMNLKATEKPCCSPFTAPDPSE
ncbi:VOC family protein [Occallatibacter riparius]|uniref:VOC family protein n=1 Tax=Occallatibacter riparius TaxID=1002689 RepID=A0A9J7BU29_9BACT|nr:VOC family protein [Occallatibacter riparius]UWZ86388.1 VOC family protein [Occallatibacter riparius]